MTVSLLLHLAQQLRHSVAMGLPTPPDVGPSKCEVDSPQRDHAAAAPCRWCSGFSLHGELSVTYIFTALLTFRRTPYRCAKPRCGRSSRGDAALHASTSPVLSPLLPPLPLPTPLPLAAPSVAEAGTLAPAGACRRAPAAPLVSRAPSITRAETACQLHRSQKR